MAHAEKNDGSDSGQELMEWASWVSQTGWSNGSPFQVSLFGAGRDHPLFEIAEVAAMTSSKAWTRPKPRWLRAAMAWASLVSGARTLRPSKGRGEEFSEPPDAGGACPPQDKQGPI